MTVKERLLALKLARQQEKNQEFFDKAGITVHITEKTNERIEKNDI